MLNVDFTITARDNCASMYLKDITPAYTLDNQGGYGGSNITKNQITGLKIKLDWGGGAEYEIEGAYTVGAEFPISYFLLEDMVFSGACDNCGVQSTATYEGAIPSGCVTITYSPTYIQDNEKVLASTKTKKIFWACSEHYQLIALAKSLLKSKIDCRYDFDKSENQTNEAMAEVHLWNSVLREMLESDEVLCDCFSADLQMMVARIKQLNTKWLR